MTRTRSRIKKRKCKFNRHEPVNIQLHPEGNVDSHVISEQEEVIPVEETEACSSAKKTSLLLIQILIMRMIIIFYLASKCLQTYLATFENALLVAMELL